MHNSISCRAGRLALAAAIAGALAAPSVAQAKGIALVTNGNDSGEGSLRWALEVEEASKVFISKKVDTIHISSTLTYAGEEPLTIKGRGQTVMTDLNVTLLAVTEGADLDVSNVNFAGPGGFSITNRGDLGEVAGKGIFVDVRDDQTGEVKLVLRKVSVSGVANHGIHVSDCSLADDCGGGSGGGGDGSPASIVAVLDRVHVSDVGNGKFDADGFRADDRGAGSIHFTARNSSFTGVGADGVELDEGDEGGVYADIKRSDFSNNGAYCDPTLLAAYLPDPDEAEFAESEQVTEDQIPGPVTGSPDDSCIEREVDFYDSGFVEKYEFGIDLDDGIDLDEAGPGSLHTFMLRSTIHDNLDEGVDFDEEDGGDIRVKFVATEASGNNDDGFKFSEEDGGGVYARMVKATAMDNGGKGMVFEEEGDGDLEVAVVRSRTANNDDSDDTGIEAVQEDDGTGTLRVRASHIKDGIDTDGVDEI